MVQICLWVMGDMTESQWRADQAALFLLRPPALHTGHNAETRVAPPWRTTKVPPLTMQQLHPRNMAQMKEQIKTPEKIQVSNEEIANLSLQNAMF